MCYARHVTYIRELTTGGIAQLPSKGLLEKDVSKQIVDYLRLKSWVLLRLHSGLVRGKTGGGFIKLNDAGTPDYCAVRARPEQQILFLEMKRERGGVISDIQKKTALQYESQGLTVKVVSSLTDFQEWYENKYERSQPKPSEVV